MSFCFYRLDFTNFVTLLTTPLGTCLDTFTVSSPSGATSSSASPLCGTNSNQHSEWQKFAFLKTRQFLDEKHYAKFFIRFSSGDKKHTISQISPISIMSTNQTVSGLKRRKKSYAEPIGSAAALTKSE